MQIVAVTNIKGGVGKTTTCVNLAYLCATGGKRTLLWDLDPQGAATYTLRCEANQRISAKQLIAGTQGIQEVVIGTEYENLDVLPSDFSYRKFDVHLSERKRPTLRLLRMSRAFAERYDTLFLDSPPGISLLTENVLRAADIILVPVIPSPLSLRMLGELQDFLIRKDWKGLQLMPFFSMVDRRKRLHQEIIDEARKLFPQLLSTQIPYASDIERMTARRAPLPAYSPRGAFTQNYWELWAEVQARATRSR